MYIIFDGNFEIVRKKRNKLTLKEEAHNVVQFVNQKIKNRKDFGKQEKNSRIVSRPDPINIKMQVANMNCKLPPTFIKMATVGKGFMLGQEDVIN